KEVANFLNMGFSVTNSETSLINDRDSKDSARHKTEDLHVELYPTQSTYEVFDRWKEVYDYNNSIPYPEDAIKSPDWKGLSETIIDANFGSDLHAYIKNKTSPTKDGEKVKPEDLAKEYK